MTQISRLRNAEIANGNLINADDIAAELNQLVSESNGQDTRLTGIESGSLTLSGNKTFSGNNTYSGTSNFSGAVTLSGTVALSGQTNLARSSDPGTPSNGDFWYNSTSNIFKAQINGNTVQMASFADLGAYPTGYHGSAAPVYASTTTATVAFIRERDSSDTVNLIKTASTTIDITTTGLNGIAQSANLGGTISVSASGTSVTGSGTTFTTTYKVGDVISTAGLQSRLITAIANDTAMTVTPAWTSTESAVTYKRGGRATSGSSKTAHYCLYAVAQAAGTNPGLLLSTRNVAGGDTLVDLPTGYTLSTQLAFVVSLDLSGNIIPFRVGAGWPKRPLIILTAMETAAGLYRILSNFSTATFTTMNAGTVVPPVARLINLDYEPTRTGGTEASFFYRETGSGLTTGRYVTEQATTGYYVQSSLQDLPVNASQQFDIRANISASAINGYITGYTITEVP